MSRWHVLLTDSPWPAHELEQEILAEVDAALHLVPCGDSVAAREEAARADALLTCWAPVTAELIAAAPRLQIIARLGIGLDNIDIAAATARGIVVTNVPDYCHDEVAEHALALLLALARRVAHYHHDSKSGRYDRAAGGPIERIAGRRLGIVGLGSTGRALAWRAAGIGLRVVAATRRAIEPPPGVELVGLDELLATSDFVSLHVPLTPHTRHIIDERTLARMRPGAYLINTARGGLIDHAALSRALAAGHLAGAALDVQDPEPPDLNLPPYNDPRVIVTPHAAFLSERAVRELRTRAARQVVEWLAGRIPPDVVNPDALGEAQRPER